MSRFNPDAEEQQRRGDMSVRQSGVFEPAGKAQTVHQSEHEGDDPGRAGGDTHVPLPAAQNLRSNKNDAQCYRCLDRPLRDVDVAERCQGDMAEGKE